MLDKEEIRKLRAEAGFTQMDFAQKVGVSITTISRWETGLSKPSKLALEKLVWLRKQLRKADKV